MFGLRWRRLATRSPCLKHCTRPEEASPSFFTQSQTYSEDTKTKPNFGLIFDIDGVLLRGKTVLESTLSCFKLIVDSKGNFRVPTVFLTNAGNELRSSKAAKLSALLGVHVNYDQVIMSHSPLKMLKSFHKKRTLISGQGPIVEIAKTLGFNSIITVDDLRQYYPHLDVVDHKRRSFTVIYLVQTLLKVLTVFIWYLLLLNLIAMCIRQILSAHWSNHVSYQKSFEMIWHAL